jgi:DtxR family Mn-dependent transcriptional regulator
VPGEETLVQDQPSASQQDYLETILLLARTGGGPPRVSDIARARSVSLASVCQALQRLDRDGFVRYTPGDRVELTDRGARIAHRMTSVHRFLASFLEGVLGVDGETAEKDACAMEHHLSPDTISHLVAFSQFAETRTGGGTGLLEEFRRCELDGSPHRGRGAGWGRGREAMHTLADMPEGGRARVVHLHAACPVRRRLAELGILPGVELELVRKAPMGGPVELAMDGFSLSLRRGEASRVEVEPLP